MEIQQMKIVLALVESSTMQRAADALRVTQPAVSFALKALERDLGYELFYRSRRGLVLTPRGAALLPDIREFLRLAEKIEHGNRAIRDDVGELRIAGRQGFMQYVFPALAKRLKKELPKVTIEIALSGDQDEVVEQLRSGQVDLAFAASPKIKALNAEVFHQDPVWLSVAHDHSLARKKVVKPRDVAELTLVLPSRTDRLRVQIERYLKSLPERPTILLETNDYTLMRNMIAEMGCAGFIYGHMLITESSKREFWPLPIRELHLQRELTILSRHETMSPHVERSKAVMIRAAKEILR